MGKTSQFGPALRRLRKQRGLTQAEVAERLGLDRTGASRYEAPGSNLTTSNLRQYLAAIGASLTDLDEALKVPDGPPERPDALDEELARDDLDLAESGGHQDRYQALFSEMGYDPKASAPEALQPVIKHLARLEAEMDKRLRKLEEDEPGKEDNGE